MTDKSLKEEIEFIVRSYGSNLKPYEGEAIINNILSLFEKRLEEIIEHTNIGECPECDKDGLKRFKELLK